MPVDYTATPNYLLKKPAAGCVKTNWPGYINGNFDIIDTVLGLCLRKDTDPSPDADNVRTLGSALLRWLNGYFNQITLGGITRSAWPSPGSGSQSMDDVYNNGSVIDLDNTNMVYTLSTGKKFILKGPGGTTTHLSLEGGKGIAFPDSPPTVLSFTRDMTLTTNQSITGVGFTPGAVIVIALQDGAVGKISWGFATMAGTKVAANKTNASAGVYDLANSLIRIWQLSADYYIGTLSTFDTDGMTLTWTRGGAITGTLTCLCLFFR